MYCNIDAESSNLYFLFGPNVHSTSIYLGKHKCSGTTMDFSIIKPLLTVINNLQLKSSTYNTVAPTLISSLTLLQLKVCLI